MTLTMGILESGSAWSPALLFDAGQNGAWYDPSDISTLWQDTAATTPVTTDGQTVARVDDKSGNGYHLSQSTASARPTYRNSGGKQWLSFDGNNDNLRSANGVLNASTLTTCLAAGDGGSFQALMGLPQAPSSHNNPYWRYCIYHTNVGYNVRINGTEYLSNGTDKVSDCIYWFDSSISPLEANEDAVTVFTPASLTYPNSVPLIVGANAIAAEAFLGPFYGAVILPRSPSADEKSKLIEYMAAKAGVTL